MHALWLNGSLADWTQAYLRSLEHTLESVVKQPFPACIALTCRACPVTCIGGLVGAQPHGGPCAVERRQIHLLQSLWNLLIKAPVRTHKAVKYPLLLQLGTKCAGHAERRKRSVHVVYTAQMPRGKHLCTLREMYVTALQPGLAWHSSLHSCFDCVGSPELSLRSM
jgi:hypothetical protein